MLPEPAADNAFTWATTQIRLFLPWSHRLKKEYDAAFDLLKHCLTIDPYAASALYEISYYMFHAGAVGQAALKAVENAPDNYCTPGTCQPYQQQDEKEKAQIYLKQWQSVFQRRKMPCCLIDLYNQKIMKSDRNTGSSGREARKKSSYDGEVSYLFANEGWALPK